MKQNYDTQDDAALVSLVLAGEREAFGPLLLRYSQSVLRLCRQLLGPTPEAQDAAQEAALQAFLNLVQLQEPARFGAWLHAIAANLARMVLRRRRVVSLETLHEELPFVLLGAASIPTPEEAYAAREIHDAVVQALEDLSAVNRDVVIGFFLDGYSYAELAELLGVPVSTVRGRLFQGRRQLRQALSPLAREGVIRNRRPTPINVKEITMEQPELVEMDMMGIHKFTRDGADPSFVVTLYKQGTDQQLPIAMSEAEAGVIWHARGQPWHAAPAPVGPDLTLRLLTSLTAKVERVVIRQLVENTFYTTITLAHGEQRSEVDVRPVEGLALGSASEVPIYVAQSVLTEVSVDTADWQHDPGAKQQFMDRLAARVDSSPSPVPSPAPLSPEIQAQIDDRLSRLRADTEAETVLLMHMSGTLVAAQGAVDKAILTRYCRALAVRDHSPQDVAETHKYIQLLMDEIFPADWWVLFWQLPSDWRIEIGGPPDTGQDADTKMGYLKPALQELESLLSASPRK